MSRPAIYIAITNHGFGHAVRAASVAAKIQRLCPDILLFLVTTAPRWLLESYISGPFVVRPRAFDVGVIQSDSITMDKGATLEKLRDIRRRERSIMAGEVSFIRQNRIGLLLADIPPLAAPIARAAGIPGFMMGNFGWDFIYRDWGGEFGEIADWAADCFGQCDRLFRLPFHEPMSAFPNIRDVGLTGGDPRYDLSQLRGDFGIDTPPEKTVMLTFGGLGLAKIPYQNLRQFPDHIFITFDNNSPDLPNLIPVRSRIRSGQFSTDYSRIRPVDLMPLCGRVISKPGFSTFSEALRLDVPLVSLVREGFAEAPLLMEGLQNYARHQILTSGDFFEGDWDFLRQPFNPPRQSRSLDKNGGDAIAKATIELIINN
ncbi:glycosyl transferase [Lyngbya sp. CCY1209]|uniref:glycosyl transferase n=1 Tax=Lyngbya sp. CCY1209 TaxID=2886103 RepID=UPI002D209364|nr:glycosyl transferase [Lyngbya sp. CCY1209]MEB3882042.1 glycosyl transferase [Lyngbya sp. CCY1209]